MIFFEPSHGRTRAVAIPDRVERFQEAKATIADGKAAADPEQRVTLLAEGAAALSRLRKGSDRVAEPELHSEIKTTLAGVLIELHTARAEANGTLNTTIEEPSSALRL